VPFDIPEAETEIVGGPLTELLGKKLALLRLMIDMELVVGLALIGALFLGGFVSAWGPVFSLFNFVWKTLLVLYVMTLVRTVFARLRIEQRVEFCWNWLLPATFLQFLLLVALNGRVF
jgi:NADH-quinone oxidoreductase subunit H